MLIKTYRSLKEALRSQSAPRAHSYLHACARPRPAGSRHGAQCCSFLPPPGTGAAEKGPGQSPVPPGGQVGCRQRPMADQATGPTRAEAVVRARHLPAASGQVLATAQVPSFVLLF